MPAPTEILDLIERFNENAEEYTASSYKELRLRTDFIDPFFHALGWDMRNEERRGEIYREVVYEDTVQIEGKPKAPDYSFRVGNTRKFFVETKQPFVNIKTNRPSAFQLRRYAWSAALPLSILTNFRELAVYDGRVEPRENDDVPVARVFYLTHNEYSTKWEKIESIFSRDAAYSGAYDDFVWTLKDKRGGLRVDASFLNEIESWRAALAKSIAASNRLTTRELNEAVQLTIDRIVFLRICEDRGIERYGRLRGLLDRTHVYKQMCELFHQADQRYNSGLFHFEEDNSRSSTIDNWTLELSIADNTLANIIRNLYYPNSPYEFSVMPADILGHVYEQFLGKVISQTSKGEAIVEDKPEVKNAGGVYYTPGHIVDYIVRQILGRLCEGKTPDQVAKLHILDPACGSGSFLIGAYQYLLDWHLAWYISQGIKKYAKKIYQGPGGVWYLSAAEKKRILLNNIFGVDIDAQAIEVTKLSLLLKVLEGESEQSISDSLRLFHERALPDLATNIKWGNTLIEKDFYNTLGAETLSKDEEYRLNVFDWNDEFPEIMESGGFDAVIGNPPYGAYLYETDKAYLNSKYPNQSYQLDSYLLFLERAMTDLLVSSGYYGMIIPNPWLTNLFQKNIRKFIMSSSKVIEIVHFKFPIFPKVTVDTEIVILQKSPPEDWQTLVTVVDSLDVFRKQSSTNGVTRIIHEQQKWIASDGEVINIFLRPEDEELALKCFQLGEPLSYFFKINVGIKPYQVGKGRPPQTREIVESRIYDSGEKLDDTYRPYLRGGDIRRYRLEPLELRYLKYGPWLAEPRPAANFDAPIKIVMRQTGDALVAMVDTERYLCLNNMHVLVPKEDSPSSLYALGVINSNLLNWYYRTLNPEAGEALAEVKKANVAKLPLMPINLSNPKDRAAHDGIVKMVEHMLLLHRQSVAAKTESEKIIFQRQIDATDKQINALVYELYNLTSEEIELIERSL